jgi:hypothetical protein
MLGVGRSAFSALLVFLPFPFCLLTFCDAWTKSVGDRITRDASTAKVDQVFGSDFDHLPL